jgi:oxygen-dependent protoporphyrinogen oxidase
MKRIAIAGGGITGLVTAYKLNKLGADVTLFEASDTLGGPVQTSRENNWLTESGPNTILETSPAIKTLIEDLGINNRKLYANDESKKRFVVKNSKPEQLPSSPPEFLSSPFFSFGAKMRLAREPFVGKAPHDKEESIADFVRRRLGKEFLDYAINPFIAGVYAGDPEKLSVKYAIPKIYALEEKYGSLIRGQIAGAKERKKSGLTRKDRAQLFSFDEGLHVLIEALTSSLTGKVELGTPITRIEAKAFGAEAFGYEDYRKDVWELFSINNESLGMFDDVILTIPAYKLSEIEFLSQNNPGSLSSLNDIYYPPVTSLALGFRRENVKHPLDGFGMLVPKVEGFRILGTLFSSTLFPYRAPADHVLLTTYIGGARYPDLALLNDDELVKLVRGDLRELLGATGEPVYICRSTYQKAIPQYEVGYGKFKDEMDEFERAMPGIHLAGNFRGGISMGDCITNAIRLAETIAES